MRYYGLHDDQAEDVTRCAAEITDRGGWGLTHQCTEKRGHGPEGMACKRHIGTTLPPDLGVRKTINHPDIGEIVWFVKDGKAPQRERDVSTILRLLAKLHKDIEKCQEFLKDCGVP